MGLNSVSHKLWGPCRPFPKKNFTLESQVQGLPETGTRKWKPLNLGLQGQFFFGEGRHGPHNLWETKFEPMGGPQGQFILSFSFLSYPLVGVARNGYPKLETPELGVLGSNFFFGRVDTGSTICGKPNWTPWEDPKVKFYFF